jgi:glycosyltransferase involved in cell wall biosynthesis
MWDNKKISIALPTYREKGSIRACIDSFFNTGVVDEVIVCNNNAEPGTSEEVAKTKAKEVFEERQGYGWSCRKALQEATGDLVILCEPDGSFEPRDIFKLLAYSYDFDVVLGSRTNREFIWTGANMGWFIRWGNWAVAKYIEFLFNTTNLTDVGCTMRLLNKKTLSEVLPRCCVGGSHFGPELTLHCILRDSRLAEIPLNYRERVGTSSVTGNKWNAFSLGLQMILLITRFRLLPIR